MNIDIIYEYLGDTNVNANIFNYNDEIIVSAEFLKNNADNEYSWDKSGVKFVIKNKED